MFISSAVQLVKIGDLSIHGNSANTLGVDNFEKSHIIVPSPSNGERLPDGVDMGANEDDGCSVDAFDDAKSDEEAFVSCAMAMYSEYVVSALS